MKKKSIEIKPPKLTIDSVFILAKMKDGNIYPVMINIKTMDVVLDLIVNIEGAISIVNKPIEGLSIIMPHNQNKINNKK